MATANLRFRVNGGSLQSGTDDTVGAEDTISLTATSFAGWTSPAARWEILTYPDGFACPTGWSTDATNSAYYYLASTIDGVTPPDFDLPTALEIDAGQWGKWRFRLTVNGTVVSDICGVEIISANGVHDLAVGEEAEFGGVHRAWVGPQQENLRLFDNALTGGASVDAVYLLGVADGALVNAVVWTSITTTVAFASTATIPCSFTRTSSTTNAAVDAMEVAAVCSATAVNGFGVSTLYKAATKDAGRIKFTFPDITGASEDSAFTVQLRTGGAALSDAIVLSGTELTVAALAGAGGGVVVDSAGTFSVGGAFAPADAAFLTVGAVSGLSAEVDVTAIGTTVEFTSTSTLPFGAKRTSATTNAVVDVQRNTILTTGTAATNFGGGELWQAEDASGSAADIGRTGFYWSDAAALSAESAWIVQLRLAGDGLQTKLMLAGDGRLTVADLTLSSLATGYLYATSGVVSVGATQPAPSDAAFLTNGAVSGLSAEVNVQAITTTIPFASATTVPISLTRDDATTDSVLDVLSLARTTSDAAFGDAGIGVGVAMYVENDAGTTVLAGRISATLTDPADGAENSSIVFDVNSAGGTASIATITTIGLTVDGVIQSFGTGFVGVSLDRASAGTLTIGGTATTVAVGVPLVVSSTVSARNFGTGTSVFANLTAETTTAATVGTPVQNGPVVASAGTAYDTDDAVSRVVKTGWYTEPRSGSTVGYYARLGVDAGTGTLTASSVYYTNSGPALSQAEFVAPTFVSASGSGFYLYAFDTDAGNTAARGGVNYDGASGASIVRLLATGTGQKVGLRTNSAYRTVIDASGNQTHTFPATSTRRSEWGTAATHYIDEAADVTTTTDDTPTDVYTFAMPDNCAVKVLVEVYCYIVGSVANRAYFGRRACFNRDGGAPTEDLVDDVHTDVIGGWGVPPAIDVVAGSPSTDDVSVQVTGLMATNIKWYTNVTLIVTTTSA